MIVEINYKDTDSDALDCDLLEVADDKADAFVKAR
mgnify:CR=1 FL=1